MTDKLPSLDVKGQNIQPNTFGEIAWTILKEYTSTINPKTLATEVQEGDRQLHRAVLGSVVEAILILSANKFHFDLIDMLGMLERAKGNILKQVDAQQNRALYDRAKQSVEAQKEAKDVIGSISP